MEDLPEEEQDTTGLSKYGAGEAVSHSELADALRWLSCARAGLENAGNTCYMNSSLQCLYRVPEVRQALKAYDGGAGGMAASINPAHKLTARPAFSCWTQEALSRMACWRTGCRL